MDIAARIIALRKEKGYNTNQLAKLAGIGYSTLYEVEIGKKQPTIATLELICKALGITLSEFFNIDSQVFDQLPPEIWKLVSDKNNYGLLKEIQARKNKGYSNELIIEWLKSLDKTLEMVKQKGVYWVEGQTGEPDMYSNQEKKEIIKGLEEKLKDPNFKRPWKKE